MSYRDAIDDMMRVALGNGAVVVSFDGTTALITDTGNRDAADCEMRSAHTFDLAAVGGGIAETDDVAHGSAFLVG